MLELAKYDVAAGHGGGPKTHAYPVTHLPLSIPGRCVNILDSQSYPHFELTDLVTVGEPLGAVVGSELQSLACRLHNNLRRQNLSGDHSKEGWEEEGCCCGFESVCHS